MRDTKGGRSRNLGFSERHLLDREYLVSRSVFAQRVCERTLNIVQVLLVLLLYQVGCVCIFMNWNSLP